MPIQEIAMSVHSLINRHPYASGNQQAEKRAKPWWLDPDRLVVSTCLCVCLVLPALL